MIALGLIAALASPIFAEEEEEEEFLRKLGFLPHQIWACDGLRSEWNRVNEPFILEGNGIEYRYKFRGSETVLKLVDEERLPRGHWVYAKYLRNQYGDSIIGAAYIWCDFFAFSASVSLQCDQASEMKIIDLMWDQPNREAKCLKMN